MTSGGGIVYSGNYTNGIVLSNPATQNPATIAATGTVANTGTALYGAPVAGWSVSNLGTIEGTGTAGAGIVLALGGSIANSGLIAGYLDGVLIDNTAGTVSNTGTIEATNLSLHGPGIDLAAGGTIDNSGRTSGLELGAGGSVTNNSGGTIGVSDAALSPGTIAPYSIAISGPGTVVNSGFIGASNVGPFVSSTGGVTISGAGTVTNSGEIHGAIVLDAGGAVANAPGALLLGGAGGDLHTGTFYQGPAVEISGGAGSVANSGTISGVTLGDGGVVGNAAGAEIDGIANRSLSATTYSPGVAIAGAAGVVTNDGTISAGVGLHAGGSVANLGTITAGNETGSGGMVGVSLAAGGSVGNGASGLAGALISGSYAGIIAYGDSTLVNFGTIRSTGGGYSGGVYLGAGGTVTNLGAITGYCNGVGIVGASGTLVNDGRIAASGSFGTGVTLGGDGSALANAGRIRGAGGTAVYLAGGYDNLLIQPGARFGGAVTAAGTYDTLELAAGSQTGRLVGLGSKFSGFAALGVDPGAVWSVSGSAPDLYVDNDGVLVVNADHSLTLGQVVSDPGDKGVIRILSDIAPGVVTGGTVTFAGAVGAHEHVALTAHDTLRLDHPLNFKGTITNFSGSDMIDLVNQAADAVSFADHRLSVTDNGVAIADLHFGTFPGSGFYSINFALSSDGHGGTDITLAPHIPTLAGS